MSGRDAGDSVHPSPSRRSAASVAPAAGGSRRWRWRPTERGDFNVLWALGMAIIVLFLGGMSTDLWHVVSGSRTLDAAADSSAAAGASGIDVAVYNTNGSVVLDPNRATQLAAANLASQTGLPGNPMSQIVVAPTDITVTLHGQVHLTLLQLFLGRRSINLTSTANASPRAGPP